MYCHVQECTGYESIFFFAQGLSEMAFFSASHAPYGSGSAGSKRS